MKYLVTSTGHMAMVDDADHERLSRYKWHRKSTRGKHYFHRCTGRNSRVLLHHDIMPIYRGFEIDHVSGDTMDNRRENLRRVTHKENMRNIKWS